jgi:phosphatidate cytidylyltransferase
MLTLCHSLVPEPEPKPTKSALKKAARAARKQLQQAKPKPSRTPSTDTPSLSPSGSAFNPVEIPHEAEGSLQKAEHTPSLNGSFVNLEPIPPPVIPAPEIQLPLPQPSGAAAYTPPQPAAYAPPESIEVPPPPVETVAPREFSQLVVEKMTAENSNLAAEQTKKRQNVVTRTLWTFIMIGTFLGTAALFVRR